MKWTDLYVHNFLSLEEVSLKLDQQGLVLIEGKNNTNGSFKSNGSGKSNLIDSLVYAIFDVTSKGIKADEVVNKNYGKNTVVILEGEKDGSTYRIERYRKHSKNKNKVKLFLNDKDITEKSTKDTNQRIQEIVGVDYETFINSLFFSQGTGAGRFSQATDKEKKKILENLVNLDVYAEAQEVAKERIKDKEKQIEDNKKEQEKLEWELSNVDALEEQDKQNYETTKRNIEAEENNIQQFKEQLESYRNQHEEQVQQEKTNIEELQKQLNEVSTGSSAYSEATAKLQEVSNNLNRQKNDKQSIMREKDNIVKQYKDVQNKTHCPVCGNELDKEHREEEMDKLKTQLKEYLVSIQNYEQSIEELEKEYQQVEKEYNDEKQKNDEIVQKHNQIFQDIQEKQNIVNNYENALQQYQNKITNSETVLNKLREVPEPTPRDDERKDIKDKMEQHKEAELGLEKDKSNLENVVKVYSNSGVKSHVLDLITPYLNKQANKYLKTLSGSDIEILFSTQTKNKNGEMSEKFDVQVTNTTGGETYQSNSEGEKKRIDLAISLAIQDLVLSKADISSNIIFYDEVFDALDSVGTENVVELLKERLSIVGSIFVISHSESLKEMFENVVTVTKNKEGVSHVEGGSKGRIGVQ